MDIVDQKVKRKTFLIHLRKDNEQKIPEVSYQ